MQPINRDSLPHLLACLVSQIESTVHTALVRGMARWWGIDLAQGCRFYGIPSLHRLPRSQIRIGPNCQFRSASWSNAVGLNRECSIATLSRDALIEIGEGCGFSSTSICAARSIRFGKRVMCGANVAITDTDFHPIPAEQRILGASAAAAPILIHDDVWLGMNVIVLKGVEIGSRTVVAAGSIVNRSLPPDVLAAGQPARVMRVISDKRIDEVLVELGS